MYQMLLSRSHIQIEITWKYQVEMGYQSLAFKTSRATYKTDHTLIRTDCKVFCKHRDESVAYEWISNIICEQLLDDLSLFSLSLQCVVAVQSALCPKAAMRLVAVCVNQSFRALDANSAGLDSTPTPTVKVRKQKHKPEKRVCINAHILY